MFPVPFLVIVSLTPLNSRRQVWMGDVKSITETFMVKKSAVWLVLFIGVGSMYVMFGAFASIVTFLAAVTAMLFKVSFEKTLNLKVASARLVFVDKQYTLLPVPFKVMDSFTPDHSRVQLLTGRSASTEVTFIITVSVVWLVPSAGVGLTYVTTGAVESLLTVLKPVTFMFPIVSFAKTLNV